MKKLKLFFALFAMLALGVGNAWGADSGITASDGVFVIDFYNSEKLTSTSGSNLSTSNYSDFVKVATGITKSDVVTTISTEGNVRYGMNGGLTAGSGSNNSSSVTFNIGSDYAVNKITVYATLYESGRWLLNGKAADSGSLGERYAEFSEVTEPLVWDNLNGATTLKFTKDNGSGSNQKRLTIYTIVCEYTTSGGGTEEPALSATPTEIDFGTVYQGTTVEDKTVAVNFENLTGAVTYSGLSTPFTATGAISATGDKITISADASTIGERSQTLTIQSAADSKTAEVTVKMNVVEKPAPTGTFTLHTGELIEGDYVIYYSGKAMKAVVSSANRLEYEEVTPSGNEIVDPLAETIWHIAPSGDNWTIYNDNKGYAAGNGSASKAVLVADLTGDNAKKAAWTVTGTSTYDFVNVWNDEKNVNKTLRNNGQHGFACYATATGGALSLYRKAGEKYDVIVNSTTNGTVTADPTSAEAGTTITLTVTPETGYVLDALTVTDASSNIIEVADNMFTMPAADVTIAATFKENEKPAATLTLSKNGDEEPFPGSWKQDDVVTLPSITSDCVKEFVGWSANPTCNVDPEYKAGDSYTLALTAQTLYAVYADVEETTTTAAVDIHEYASANSWGSSSYTNQRNIQINSDITVTISATDGNTGKYYGDGIRIYQTGNPTITISTTSGELKSVNFTFTNYNTGTLLNNGVAMTSGTAVEATGTSATYTIGDTNPEENKGQIRISAIEVTYGSAPTYSNYSTTCSAAPKAEVNPAEVTATATGGNGTVSVTYENVNTANVAVALFNDEDCTEAFAAGWLTTTFDGDKNINYAVAENTTYAERTAYIQLTAPEANGATDPAVVVIPVTQAGKDKVFASLAELVAADLTAGDEVTVTLNNDVIKSFYTITAGRAGVVFDVQKDGKDIKIFYNNQTTIGDWEVGGKLSGTLTNVKWSTYSNEWQLAPTANTWDWANLTYTAPATVASIAVSGTPTKTTYVDGEVFNPAGLVATATYTDATTEDVTNLVNWTFDPATLAKGQTSVNVVALLNSVSSPAYTVNGLTVNDIPTKTVAEFIAAGGVRCYLEGIVSNIANTEYGNFDLTDASGTIFVYGCLNAAGEKQKFAELGVKKGDKIKVIADQFKVYSGKNQATDVQYVSHISAATITIADITMEVEEVATITPTVDPVDAVVTYTIKENAANAISLEGNTITALVEGTATITATVAEGATYLGNSVDFTVTVGPKTESEEVVILAELDGKWYAMKGAEGSGTGQLAALEVTYFNGTLYNVAEADKASITWTRTIVDGKATFVNNGKYLKGKDGNLSLVTTADNNCKWTSESGFYTTGDNRTFIYRDGYNFKNYSVQNVGNSGYSGFPEVVVPVYATGDVVYTRTVTNGNYGTICIPYASSSYSGAKFYEVSWLKTDAGLYLDELAEGAALEAGKPYIFLATNTEITVTCTGAAVADPVAGANGLTGTFTDIAAGGVQGNYIIAQNKIWVANENNYVNAYRAYIKASELPTTEQAQLPGRRRVCMGENVETGVEDIITTDAPVKVIENGQLIIIRDGVKYNVQGQKL